MLQDLLGPEFPEGIPPVALVMIPCGVWDLTLSLELTTDLAVEGLLVGFDGQEDVGALGEAPLKKDFVVCSASAWMRTPSRSMVLSSSLRAARSLDWWVS